MPPAPTVKGSSSGTASDLANTSVHDFIVSLESSAKKVLRDANDRAREAALKEQAQAIVEGRRAEKLRQEKRDGKASKTGTVLMKALNVSSSMLDLEDPAVTLGRMPPGTETLQMRYSVPNMFVSMAAETINVIGDGSGDDARRTHSAGGTAALLSPIKRGLAGTAGATTVVMGSGAATTTSLPPKRNLVLEKLAQSPFLSQSMGSLDQILIERKLEGQKLKEERAAEAASLANKEGTWALKSQVNDVLKGKHSGVDDLHKSLMRKQKVKHLNNGRRTEAQGPIDWSYNGLKIKYRGENEREAAWTAWQSANAFSETALAGGLVLSMGKMERHPLFVQFYSHIRAENSQSLSRTTLRLLMKKFVFDVHEVWLTNLQHLREHNPAKLMVQASHDEGNKHDAASEEDGNGLRGRRDVRAIEQMEAQIQSVSQKRVLEKAYYTTRLPEPKVVLNYVPNPTPSLQPARPLPPIGELLIESLCIKLSPTAPTPVAFLFVERLLPPADRTQPGPGEVHGDVLWRIELYRHDTCATDHVILAEPAVVSQGNFIYERYLGSDAPAAMRPVFSTTKDIFLPWSVMDISASVCVRLGCNVEAAGRPTMLRLELKATLKADYDGDVLTLPTSPVELRFLLGRPHLPLDDLAFWNHPSRAEDTWPEVFSLLHIVEGLTNEFGDPVPEGLAFTSEKTEADRVDGALPTARAFYYAMELASSARVIEGEDGSLTLKLAGASTEMFVSPTAPPQAEASATAENSALPAQVEPSTRVAERGLHNKLLRQGSWAEARDMRAPTLSMQASGALAFVAQVPGACEHGRMGLWFPHKMEREYTQAAAVFFRDPRLSTTDTVFVNMTFALDTSIINPTVLAWEDFATNPPKNTAEEVEGYIPALVAPPGVLLLEALISPIDERMSETAALFSTIPEEGIDHVPMDVPNKPKGMLRQWAWHNPHGFRRKVINTLLGVDPVLPTIVFGITKYGAQPNGTGVNPRNIWHSTLAITEHINRPRAPKDYHYILVNIKTRGANDPAAFAAKMKSGECVGLMSTAFNSFEKEYAEIKLRREIFARQLALDAKIEHSQMVMKTREKAIKAEMQKELQRAIEKKLRKATKSEKGWSKRFHLSTLLEVQGNWERRRDDRAGTIFFRRITSGDPASSQEQQNEQFMQTCQWEVPATWEGDPLSVPDDEYGPEEGFEGAETSSLKSGSLAAASSVTNPVGGFAGAFEQPPEVWHPAMDDNMSAAGREAGQTGGMKPAFARRAPKAEAGGASLKSGRDSANDTVLAERSFADSVPATIDTANLEHIAEQLVSSDELMRVIARRLGLDENKVVPTDELQSLFSISVASSGVGSKTKGRGKADDPSAPQPLAPRDKFADRTHFPEFDSDDDLWSDDEHEAGDYDEDDLGNMPQDHKDNNEMRKKKMREGKGDAGSVPSQVPFLNLKGSGITPEADAASTAAGWRRLPRPEIPTKFFHKCTQTKTLGPDREACNTLPVPIFLTPISPVDACQYTPQSFSADIESIFVPDCRKDMERALATLERNIKREEDLSKNMPTDDILLFGAANEMTAADQYIARQFKDDQQAFVDPKEKGMKKALLAAKSNNIAEMEDALEDEVPINTADAFGNTLLILAAQQGSKRMCKFLLRRGANINMQSLVGNTALHYCFAYGFHDLGHYLIGKGADDSIVNADGLTPFEGISAEQLGLDGGDGGDDDEED